MQFRHAHAKPPKGGFLLYNSDMKSSVKYLAITVIVALIVGATWWLGTHEAMAPIMERKPNVTVYDDVAVPTQSTTLDLSGQGLEGSLKAEIFQLKELEVLDLSDNNFTGVPAEVGRLSNLRVLDLSNNPITGLPYEIGQLQKLERLDLRGTNYAEYDLGVIRSQLPESVLILTDDVEVGEEDELLIIDPVVINAVDSKADLIVVENIELGERIASPATITGQARGYWFFEASFPVVLTDWDGKIIAEHYATTSADWMTEEFVPFATTIEFESPYKEGDPYFMQHGTLILMKDNPSDLPENDDALEIPVRFVQN